MNRPLKLLSNVGLTNHFPGRLEIARLPATEGRPSGFVMLADLVRAYAGADRILVFNADAIHAAAAVFAKAINHRLGVFFYDTNLRRPESVRERLLALIKRVLFRAVDGFLVMHKDTSAYSEWFGISEDKFRYVPFKANNFEFAGQVPTSDGNYIFAGGASYRDVNCLIDAVRDLAMPVRLVLPPEDVARIHHTPSIKGPVPEHVTVIRQFGMRESWNELLANSTIVVVPVIDRCIQPAGISVYLEAMALGKPVVISRGPSTNGLISEDIAGLYRAGDSKDLGRALRKMIENAEYRARIAERGRQYALSLGGADRLSKDLQAIMLEGRP